jgi:polysaccharide pyruvyl transferase WcaK-like protein
MKLFFAGDNRTNLNWGRGASIALRETLSGPFEITGCVTGDWLDLSTAEAGYVATVMPPKYYGLFRFLWLKRRRRPFGWYIRLEKLMGAKDFIAEDPIVSVDNLIVYKQRHPALARIYDSAAAADMIVVDGDGDIIFSTPPRRQTLFLLAMIELGIRLKKPTFLVNSMISDCPSSGRNSTTLASAKRLLEHCNAVALRDPESLDYVRQEMPNASSTLIPDSLFTWQQLYATESSRPPAHGDFLLPYPESNEYWGKLDFSQPYICIGGGALAGTDPDRAAECYGRLVDAVRQLGYQVYLTENDVPDSFLQRVAREKNVGIIPVNTPILMCGAVLAHARLFISGRYHPSIFASLGGTPCIFLGSHAHKMASLSRVLEYERHVEFDAFPDHSDIAAIVTTARKYLDQGEPLRTRILQVAKRRSDEASGLPTFLRSYIVS